MKYTILCIAFLISACSSKKDAIKKIYNDRENIANTFSSKSVLRSRGQNIVFLYTHNLNKTNKYFFEVKEAKTQFTNDSIEYVPDILQFKNTKGSELYSQELASYINTLLAKMDSLDIRDIKGDLYDVGIDLKIYLKEFKGIMLYVSHPQKVALPYWLNYLQTMEKLDDNWYYSTKPEQ